MRVLFDHNVPHKLRHSLEKHEVTTADEIGWAELENGELLGAAEAEGFDVMVTGDKNLSCQQNLKGRKLVHCRVEYERLADVATGSLSDRERGRSRNAE